MYYTCKRELLPLSWLNHCIIFVSLSSICRSMDDPPTIPAFTPPRRQSPSPMAQLTSALTHIAGPMTPSSQSAASVTTTTSGGISPAKLASLRTNYLQQMRDLHLLLESGAISETEFREPKMPILQQLKRLVPE